MRAHARRVMLVAAAAVGLQSCASFRSGAPGPSCGDFVSTLYPAEAPPGLTLVGKARIDLPRYRVRGVIRILHIPPAALRIDFRHSSLFGAYREDATILLAGDSLSIVDRERGRLFGADSSAALVGDALGIEILPDDFLHALLLASPPCPELSISKIENRGSTWNLSALWRGRDIRLKGKSGSGLSEFTQCISGKTHCYKINYRDFRDCGGIRYPARIRITAQNGEGSLSLEFSRMECGMVDPGEVFSIGLVSP